MGRGWTDDSFPGNREGIFPEPCSSVWMSISKKRKHQRGSHGPFGGLEIFVRSLGCGEGKPWTSAFTHLNTTRVALEKLLLLQDNVYVPRNSYVEALASIVA